MTDKTAPIPQAAPADPAHADDAALKARLAALSHDLQTHTAKVQGDATAADGSAQAAQARGRAMNTGARIVSEFVAALAVSGLIGWELDRFAGTRPWLFIVLLLLGFVTGFYNVIRIGQQQGQIPPKP